jgi:hypothetical protein
MTNTMTKQLTEVEERILDGLTSLQDQLVEANTKAADRLHELSLPTPDVKPVIEPSEAVARYYDFAGKLMDANRKFAEQVVAAWYPATKTTKQAPAKKATARKATAKVGK